MKPPSFTCIRALKYIHYIIINMTAMQPKIANIFLAELVSDK